MKRILYLSIVLLFAAGYISGEQFIFDGTNDFSAVVIGNSGLFITEDEGISWADRSEGLPRRIVYPEYSGGIKTLTAMSVGAVTEEGRVILVSTSDSIFRTLDSGRTWHKIPTSSPVKPADYFASISGHPDDKDTIIIGTSFSGMLETHDAGKTWVRYADELKALYKGAGFYEEILHLEYGVGEASGILLGTGYTNEFYVLKNGVLEQTSTSLISTTVPDWAESLRNQISSAGQHLKTHTDKPNHLMDRRGLYLNSVRAGGAELDTYLDFCHQQGLDSIVIDFKDDNGIVTFDIRYSLPREIGAVRERIKLDDLVEKIHSRGMYLIGRIVVFKDKKLYQQKGYPIMDRKGGTWGKKFKVEDDEGEIRYEQREFWVDPFNPLAWDYNASIAKELQERGVDEIQFDYIRFPSDGDTSRAVYPSQRAHMTRIEALESFLIRVREDIHIPISTDLYGFNSWYRMGNWIGQNIDMLSNYVDVICPMFYPSHFPREFLNSLSYLDRAEFIYKEGSNRAAAIVGGRAVIRPYVQAFLLPSEYYMEKPEYTRYLNKQIKGTMESRASGFLLWNNSNRYYMVNSGFADLTRADQNREDTPLD